MINNNQIQGIFIIKREFGNNVALINKVTSETTIMDYFEFEKKLKLVFDIDKAIKILDNINCSRKVLIDFDKKIAKLIVEKDIDFNSFLMSYLTAKNVETELSNPFEDDEIYSRFQTL